MRLGYGTVALLVAVACNGGDSDESPFGVSRNEGLLDSRASLRPNPEDPGASGSPASSDSAEGVETQGTQTGDDGGFVPAPGAAVDPGGTPGTGSGAPPSGDSGFVEEDGEPISADSPTSAEPSSCQRGIPPTPQYPLLSSRELDNTVRDLLGVVVNTSDWLPLGHVAGNEPQAIEDYRLLAEMVTAAVMAEPGVLQSLLPCAEIDAACMEQFATEFGSRAFRRPLTDAEVAESLEVAAVTDETDDAAFEQAIERLLVQFLSSPHFLTRAETSEAFDGQYFVLSPYEIASRLSYMLWASMPDAELFDAAAQGALSTSAQMRQQAVRLLSDPRAREQVAAFHRKYVGMDGGQRWANYSRDPERYPAFDEAQVPVMAEETERLFEYVVFDSAGTFQDILTTNTGFVNELIAPLYGLDAAAFGPELQAVDLGSERPGVFTRAGFLAANSVTSRTSPIYRGVSLQRQVLCLQMPAPPAGASQTPLPMTDVPATNRQLIETLTEPPACAGCHQTIIDPTGYALESFDAIGALQTLDNGLPVDTTASVWMDGTTVDVAGAADLMVSFAYSPSAHHCYAEQWVEFAYQRASNEFDACVVDELAAKIGVGNYTILDLIADLTQSDSFRLRALPDVR